MFSSTLVDDDDQIRLFSPMILLNEAANTSNPIGESGAPVVVPIGFTFENGKPS